MLSLHPSNICASCTITPRNETKGTKTQPTGNKLQKNAFATLTWALMDEQRNSL